MKEKDSNLVTNLIWIFWLIGAMFTLGINPPVLLSLTLFEKIIAVLNYYIFWPLYLGQYFAG